MISQVNYDSALPEFNFDLYPSMDTLDKGGSGSGNYGHEGRPGEVGGSGEGMTRMSGGERAKYDKESKTWKHESGRDAPDHVKDLHIPPAWQDVRYNEDPNADLRAVGTDSKGRMQAIYSDRFAQENADAKFARIQELDNKYDRIVREVGRDVAAGRSVEEASCLRVVMTTGIRPGSDTDTGGAVKAYGATTLEGRHVIGNSPDDVRLQFVGKKGVAIDIPVTDKMVAQDLLNRRDIAGNIGRLFNTDEIKVRAYSLSKDGGGFKTKDYRTLLGTRTAMSTIDTMPIPTNDKEYKKAVMTVGKAVSAKLGNTPSVALNSYVNPVVFSKWRAR